MVAALLLLEGCATARASEPRRFAPDPIGHNYVVVGGDTIPVSFLPPAESLRSGRLTEQDFEEVAAELGVEVAAIKAVTEIEAGPGHQGFWADGKPLINFDLSMYRKRAARRGVQLNKYTGTHSVIFNRPNTARYGSQQAAQQARLDAAMSIDSISAIEGTFWGMFQIGGFNYERCGTKSHAEFLKLMSRSERDQLELFAEFIRRAGLLPALRAKDWATFARGYNGPSYAARGYHTRLASSYAKHKGKK
ncbi:MAG: N-acetylmuramidase family protein [Muribaculaceae bacterium]|nr:N-acetylmuramidase family protein [Muribaculaceae bacterium]